MNAPVPIKAIRCQLDAIAAFAVVNDVAKLHVRAALRDTLEKLERPDERPLTFPPHPMGTLMSVWEPARRLLQSPMKPFGAFT